MSGDISMAQVIEALGEVYLDDGIAAWLSGKHATGKFEGQRPIDACRTPEGRYEVWALAQALADGVMS